MTEAPVAHRPWPIFWLLAVTQFMVILDTTIVAIALPEIQRDVGFTPSGLSWVMDGYMLVFGGFVLLGGRAADLAGRRRMLVLGMTLFVLSSVLCVMATEPWMLVVGRMVQGLGGALASPAALALVLQVLPEGASRTRGMAIWGGIAGVAGPTGVLLGGALSEVAWELVFMINAPIGIAVIVFGLRMLPGGQRYVKGDLDVFGALSGTAGLCLLVFGVMRGAVEGWGSAVTVLTLGAAVVLLLAFVARQVKAANPLLPRSLFGVPTVVLGVAASGLLGMALYGSFITNTLNLQQARGYSAIVAALLLIPLDICLFAGTSVAGRVMARMGPSTVLSSGLGLQAVALVWWASVLDAHDNVWLSTVLPASVASFGLGAAIVCVFVIGTSNVSGELSGTASGMVVTANQVGGAIGIAALTTVAATHTTGLLAGGAPDRAQAVSSGQSVALWVAAGVAAVGALVGLLLKRDHGATWRRATPVAAGGAAPE
ncbi:MFS transporter [Amycolatopsis roodepoortensis]|uniref:MFS transporter n=1 Tax=Amycolatopsis roodepoortensis TaxID=700274 RepID=UPI00214C3EC2|nr:MFS transporter [Amycolatopsis roodepoortensis]UUV31551.1 MFS transporter [Amycolatopsis roodepoortensis]